jgi:uncharacterized membrane protein YbaN (DUF454 family)
MAMTDWYMVLGWGSPIGIGIFLCLMGTMVFMLAKADESSKRAKQYKDNKEEKK